MNRPTPQGFGPPQQPRYWVQVVYLDNDTDDRWVPVHAPTKPRGMSRESHRAQVLAIARDAAALWLGQPGVDFVLVLDGAVPEGGCPAKDEVIDDFNRVEDMGKGCQVYQLQTKAARRMLACANPA